MSAHTPGPWRVRFWPDGQPNLIEGSDGEWVCTFADVIPSAKGRQIANAHLIASAKDLLSVLEAIVNSVPFSHMHQGTLTRAHAAIAKAKQ